MINSHEITSVENLNSYCSKVIPLQTRIWHRWWDTRTYYQWKNWTRISFYALIGWSTSKTMWLTAQVIHLKVTVPIENSSIHNFISKKIVNMLHLPVIPTEPFNVKVATMKPLKCQRKFEHLHVLLQGIHFSFTLYSLLLTRLDFMLDIQWLEQLGTIIRNWKKWQLNFNGKVKCTSSIG